MLDASAYNRTARHFDAPLPPLLRRFLPMPTRTLADFGCGDGPWFAALKRDGIGLDMTIAVDLDPMRLERVRHRFPRIVTITSQADDVPKIPDGSLDLVISTMVMEHVPDEGKYLREIRRVLRPGGRAYITTVYKKRWAWYFRKRNGESVLDTSHLREYTDLDAFGLLVSCHFRIVMFLGTEQLWFPLLDPILFRLGIKSDAAVRLLRFATIPIPGYFSLIAIVEK